MFLVHTICQVFTMLMGAFLVLARLGFLYLLSTVRTFRHLLGFAMLR